ncbi:hypothetical protein KC19_2G185300 [Ceratodon purpureus]|uniref:Uncharacterized protein n=1 Tax=Ceratodon purpureus TaxID=3225 RepID=A0A8T0IX02_CERPU|nr:hypothetical protein KC19_2G185300 [Ceratodon purpureus]
MEHGGGDAPLESLELSSQTYASPLEHDPADASVREYLVEDTDVVAKDVVLNVNRAGHGVRYRRAGPRDKVSQGGQNGFYSPNAISRSVEAETVYNAIGLMKLVGGYSGCVAIYATFASCDVIQGFEGNDALYLGNINKSWGQETVLEILNSLNIQNIVELILSEGTEAEGVNCGYAFVEFGTHADALEAFRKLQQPDAIFGTDRSAKVAWAQPLYEPDTLYLGNINKSWKKEMVLETLMSFDIENIMELILSEDTEVEGVNCGYAFIEFGTHTDALEAFQKLQQPDATFGTDHLAQVAWAQPLSEPDEETMSQVKSVFVDGMPPTWEEEKVSEYFGKFGEIERIVLARNMVSATRKDYGFVHYVERDAALACIDALNSTEIIDGDLKMKVMVVLAEPQLKSKFGEEIRGGYPLGFRGDHLVGTTPVHIGDGCCNGVGAGSDDGTCCSGGDSPSWDNTGRFENQEESVEARELEAEEKIVEETHSHDEIDSNGQLLQSTQEQAPEDNLSLQAEEKKTFPDPEETEGVSVVTSGGISAEAEKPSSTIGEIVIKPTLDKFECAMCGFGSDAPDDYEAHKKTKVHRVIEELRKDQKLHNKTPLSLLHEYASRNHCEVNYETKAETNGPFEVIALIGGAAGGTTGPPTKGFGAGRNKARAKQMAAADALEKIMEKVPEFEFTKPGQSRQRFGDRDRPGRKGKGGGGGNPGGSGGSGRGVGVGGGGSSGYRNPRERLNDDWRPTPTNINVSGASRFGGVGSGRNRRPDGNNMYLGSGGGSGGGGSYPSSPNAIPITGFNNDFPRAVSRSNYVDRYAGRSGTGYSITLRGGRGGVPSHPETYAERYDRIQGGRGYGGGGYGRDYLGGGVGVGGNSYGGRDVGGIAFVGREVPAALGYGGRELHHGGVLGGPSREYEGAGIKRPYAAMDEDARYLDAQRGLPRQRLDALEHVPIQQSGGIQGYGAQSLYSDAARASIVQQPMYTDASRAPVRSQDQPQYNAYGQQSQGLTVPHHIGQAQHVAAHHLAVQHVPVQHVPSQHVSAQHISTQHVQGQHIPAQHVQTQHIPAQHVQTQHIPTQHVQAQHIPTQHVHTQQATMPITMVGGPGQGGTPYSIYDAAPQSTVGVPTGTGQTGTHAYGHQYAPTHSYGGFAINQEYAVNTAVPVQEMTQATSYPAQSAYGAQYGVMQQQQQLQQQQQQVPQQRVGYTIQGATQHQQSYY